MEAPATAPRPAASAAVRPLLEVRDLVTAFDTDSGQVVAVDGVGFEVGRGRTVGLVGESGCGKTVTALSVMRLLPLPMGRVLEGEILLDGVDLLKLSLEDMRRVRGGRIGMIFQEPMTALNPVQRIGKQLAEAFLLHQKISPEEATARSIALLAKVGIPSPEVRFGEYPHQLSGGMRQRVVIAMALANRPTLVIADEPTTALDVTIQAQILALMQDLQREMGMSILLITHDLGVIAQTCDEVVVMYAGKVVERAPVLELFERPKHPYTQGLLKAIPRLDHPRKQRLLTIEGAVPALDDLPPGCRFQNRCPHRVDRCAETPPLETVGLGVAAAAASGAGRAAAGDATAPVVAPHQVACWRWREIEAP
ncbi:MAG TPA: ABC transporter ATP-binding protein [Thermoanaerobaculia bacterium]|nr:ABC transporter ATP-binding protein [Thermoanaerobaculia bacterium]